MVAEVPDELELIAQARAGQRLAFERLLVRHAGPLMQRISCRIPQRLRSVVDAEDILQEAFADGWEALAGFQPNGANAFGSWLARIAEHRLLDVIKAHRAAKRGGDGRCAPRGLDGQLTQVLSLLAVHQRTPSRSVARREALLAVRTALPQLKESFRDVLRLRFMEGLSVGEVADRMNRTEWAVQKLTARALASLREALGDGAGFLSHS